MSCVSIEYLLSFISLHFKKIERVEFFDFILFQSFSVLFCIFQTMNNLFFITIYVIHFQKLEYVVNK